MTIKYVNEVKQVLGAEPLEVLTDIFRKATGIPPWVKADRYRADHPQWFDILEQLEQTTQFFERDPARRKYELSVYALPLLEDDRARSFLGAMEEIFCFFKKEYSKRLSEPLVMSEITEALNFEPDLLLNALSYMIKSHAGLSGVSNNFPTADDAHICISEQVLRYGNFGETLSQFYEWNIINPHNGAEHIHDIWSTVQPTADGFFTSDDLDQKPKWLEELDDQKKALIVEIDTAVKAGSLALPTIGLRTLLETTMLDHIEDQRTFARNLKKFTGEGYITEQHASLLKDVIDAGNASAHRAYFPNKENLRTCIDVLKHLLHGVYVLKPKVEEVAANTPKR